MQLNCAKTVANYLSHSSFSELVQLSHVDSPLNNTHSVCHASRRTIKRSSETCELSMQSKQVLLFKIQLRKCIAFKLRKSHYLIVNIWDALYVVFEKNY
jgi:hypothetical protein